LLELLPVLLCGWRGDARAAVWCAPPATGHSC
jgi:hypothetical protein